MARILILGLKVPFEKRHEAMLRSDLAAELRRTGHEAEIVELPYDADDSSRVRTHAALWRLSPTQRFGGKDVDLLIITELPCALAHHERRSVWLLASGNIGDFAAELRKIEFLSAASEHVLSELETAGLSPELLPPEPIDRTAERLLTPLQQTPVPQ